MRVLVVGAGPTGLTAGVELARQGCHVTVIDRRDAASSFSRAVGILPRSIEILQPSGVSEKLLAEGIHLSQACFYDRAELVAKISINIPGDPHSFLLGLAQDRTEFHLSRVLERLGGALVYGIELKQFAQMKDRVFVETACKNAPAGFKDGFDYLIGADGVRSTVRGQLGFAYEGFDLPEKWSIADVEADDWLHPQSFSAFRLSGNGVVIVAPLEARRFRVIANRPDALAALPVAMNVQRIRRSGAFTILIRQAEHFSSGRVFLAGDAAHCHSPAGGRGMNLGIADAAELARRIVDGDTEGYSASRHAEGKHVIDLSERARKAMTHDNPMVRSLVMSAIRMAGLSQLVQRRFAKTVLYG